VPQPSDLKDEYANYQDFRVSNPAHANHVRPAIMVEAQKKIPPVRIDPTLSGLATSDWFRADQIVSNVREPSLRLLLKLEFAGAVLAKELKSKKSQVKQTTYMEGGAKGLRALWILPAGKSSFSR
jgi:hypothetical protein